jgi:phenylacetaldehyde dehydrogenase
MSPTSPFRGRLLIDGAWREAASGATFNVINPATEELIAVVAAGDAADIDLAVRSARKAFEGPWRAVRPAERERLLFRLADLIEAHAEELAQLESLDNGKPIRNARASDIPNALARLRYAAGWASKLEGRTMSPSLPGPTGELFAYTVKEPVGVCGQIIPWNFPLMMAISKLAPALAAGCACVLKPAEQTPLSALRLGELILEAGFPPGVVNIVTGFGETAGAALVDHPDVDKIAFTGSTEVGRKIGSRALAQMKRVSLELGGKSPVIIAEDADLEAAIRGAGQGIFNNMGQVCVAGSRLYAHERVFEDVVDGIAEVARSLRIGPGLDPETQQGPLVSEAQMKRVLGYIEEGCREGGTAHAGARRAGNQGYFVEPTVFSGLPDTSRLLREEIFGPVIVAQPYTSPDELAAVANDTEYGLAAAIWSRDISFCHKLARRIRAGTVWVNCQGVIDPTMPFGGYKQSGLGRESGLNGVELYTETKSIVVAL